MVEANQSGCLFVGEGVVLKGNFAVLLSVAKSLPSQSISAEKWPNN